MLTVGKELLIGRTLNTNAHWAGKRLAAIGTMLNQITTVDDDIGEIVAGFMGCLRRSPDFVIVVGGLGPTPDDMTLKGLAVCLGKRMSLNEEAISMIRDHYEKLGRSEIEMTQARKKMAILPTGARPVRNQVGTAPGVRLEVGKMVVFSLPGVPGEMKSIFRESVEPEVKSRLGKLYRSYVSLKLEGILESTLAPLIEKKLKRYPGAYVKSHPRGITDDVSRIELDISVVDERKERAELTVARIESEMRDEMEAAGAVVMNRSARPRSGN